MEKIYVPQWGLNAQAYFTQETWDAIYQKIKVVFSETALPEVLAWKPDRINPESFMYYDIREAKEYKPGQYDISADYLVDGTLPYYSAQSMHMWVGVAKEEGWNRIKCTYDIDTNALSIEHNLSPDEEERFLTQWQHAV